MLTNFMYFPLLLVEGSVILFYLQFFVKKNFQGKKLIKIKEISTNTET
jgi:hypothetical protein